MQSAVASWWAAYLSAGPGWIMPGVLKMLAGSFLAFLAIEHLVPPEKAAEPTQMYLVAFQYVFSSPQLALAFTGAFVIISQLKINVTNAYAGSIAWSNFFSRLTHSHPGRVVWLVFNVAIALMLMELGIFKMLEHILGLYSIVAVAWVGALVADLVINKPLGLSPAGIEFKRAHLYDINPVGVGSMLAATVAGIVAIHRRARHDAAIAVGVPRARGRLRHGAGHRLCDQGPLLHRAHAAAGIGAARRSCAARSASTSSKPRTWRTVPAYSGPICSLCCSLETRCRDCCKPHARISTADAAALLEQDPAGMGRSRPLNTDVGRYLGVLLLFSGVIGSVLSAGLFSGLARFRRSPKELLKSHALDRVLHSHDHRRRRRLAVRAGAGQPPRRRGGDAPPDRPADERNRGAQAHRRQAAKSQRGRGSGQQGQEPPRRRA